MSTYSEKYAASKLKGNQFGENLAAEIFKKVSTLSDLKNLGTLKSLYSAKKSKKNEVISLKNAFLGTKLSQEWDVQIAGARIKNNWGTIFGQGFVENVIITKIDERTIYVNVENPNWATSVKLEKAKMISRINDFIGTNVIHDILVTNSSQPSRLKLRYK